MSLHSDKAKQLFLEGYNCSQAVALAFSDLITLDPIVISKTMSSFGGGLGRLREVCGAISGMAFVTGWLYGYSNPKDFSEKKEHYSRIQEMANEFKNMHGSIVCKEILGIQGPNSSIPSERTKEFYAKRPCLRCIEDSALILDKYIENHPIDFNMEE